jgi:hypothetical protein
MRTILDQTNILITSPPPDSPDPEIAFVMKAIPGIMDALLPDGVKYDPETGEVYHEGQARYPLSAPASVLATIAIHAARAGCMVERRGAGYSLAFIPESRWPDVS